MTTGPYAGLLVRDRFPYAGLLVRDTFVSLVVSVTVSYTTVSTCSTDVF